MLRGGIKGVIPGTGSHVATLFEYLLESLLKEMNPLYLIYLTVIQYNMNQQILRLAAALRVHQ